MSDASRDGSHDFDFQSGRWRIKNVRLVKRLQSCVGAAIVRTGSWR